MSDVLIRNVAEDDLSLLDRKAARQGISRTELLRRLVRDEAAAEAARGRLDISMRDFDVLLDLASDAADEDLIRSAWSRDR